MEVIKESDDGRYVLGTEEFEFEDEDGKVDKQLYNVLQKKRRKLGTLDTGRKVWYDDESARIFFNDDDKKVIVDLLKD